MKKFVCALLIVGLYMQCSDDESPTQSTEPLEAPKVTNVFVDDITNNGDGSDLEISIIGASDETLISEYRVFVIKSTNRNSFDVATAESASADAFTKVAADGTDKKIILTATSVDHSGELIEEDIEYVVFVLSKSDESSEATSSLSSASSFITLKQTSIRITYVGNDGVYITDGKKGVLIDALPADLSGWNPIASGVQSSIENGGIPYDDVKVAMITHNHGDHFSPTSVNKFLSANANAKFISPPQVASGVSGGSAVSTPLALGESETIIINDITIEVIRITHFNPPTGSSFNSTENYAFIVELGGLKILHIGDGDLSKSNFESLDLKAKGIDVALIPTFNFSGQLTNANRDVLNDFVDPEHVIGLHLASATPSSDVTDLYPGATVFKSSLQSVRF
ncbi:MAG: MBL fold metallo-hydrolase [Cyclobacteriaceae bacterium]